MDSERARQIARETFEAIRNADDATQLRVLKRTGWSVALQILKFLLPLLVGAIAGAGGTHFGLHGGQMPKSENAIQLHKPP
jgi:hypothetical protein